MHVNNQYEISNRILRWPETLQKVGLCRSQIHNLISKGQFPSQIKLSERASGFLEEDINDWINSRVKASRGVDKNAP